MARKQQDNDNTTALTGHTTQETVKDDPVTGKVQSRHETTVVTDPTSDEAVQVPTPEENPLANAQAHDPLRREAPTPLEVFNGDAEPTSPSLEDVQPGAYEADAAGND